MNPAILAAGRFRSITTLAALAFSREMTKRTEEKRNV